MNQNMTAGASKDVRAQEAFYSFRRFTRATRLLLVGGVCLLAGGCSTQLGSMLGAKPEAVTSGVEAPMESSERTLAMASNDLMPSGPSAGTAGACPGISVWRGDSQLTIYEIGRVGDNLAIRHRGEITKTARECEIGGGRVTVKYGIAGRVLLGPVGKAGTVRLPVIVHVTDRSRQKVKTVKLSLAVQLREGKPHGNFSSVQRVSFPVPAGVPANEYNLFVTFDRNAPGAG